jgi:hypothetical protein
MLTVTDPLEQTDNATVNITVNVNQEPSIPKVPRDEFPEIPSPRRDEFPEIP